jgi:hypothetical protein
MGEVANSTEVVSKWGLFPAYRHALWEVPASYGHEVKYFRKPNKAEALRLFEEFAAE